MNTSRYDKAVVLALSGHDPTGAAGVQADMESIYANGGKCISVITALTAQNTTKFEEIIPQDPVNFRKQISLLTADVPVNACKVGLIGSPGLVTVIAELADKMHNIPWVIDPVLRSGSGTSLANNEITDGMLTRLFPHADVITPNLGEAGELTGSMDPAIAARKLFETGCHHILITDTVPASDSVVNILYSREESPVEFVWERLPGIYHGSGCTLSAAIAAHLAQNITMHTAVEKAQSFTWHSLQQATQLGRGQLHPRRWI